MKRTIARIAAGAAVASWIAAALLIAPTGSLISAAVAQPPSAEWDGLVLVPHSRLDHLWLLPEADFSGFKRVRLSPIEVSFDRNWPTRTGSRSLGSRVSSRDMENIRTTLASEFRTVLADELGRSGYTLVDEAGDDVLQVNAAIANLFITGPVTNTAGPTRTFVSNPGRMTLVADLRDSVSGELLARAVDTVQGRQTRPFQFVTPVSNLAEARSAMRQWATVLRTGLDDAEKRQPATASRPPG
jgi:hypothetical protein